VAVNSSYVFDKAAGYFAPQYDLRYDKVRGNALTGITLEGLYYKEKKLAREIKIKINPATLLEKKITVSHLALYGVNEAYLEFMISELSAEDEDNSSSSFPFSIAVSMFSMSGSIFPVSTLNATLSFCPPQVTSKMFSPSFAFIFFRVDILEI
jgi:hypothetical protein